MELSEGCEYFMEYQIGRVFVKNNQIGCESVI